MVLVNALDKHTRLSVGENGCTEYTWSNNYQEKCAQFFFQLVRTKNTVQLEYVLNDLLLTFKNCSNPSQHIHLLSLLYKMIGQTRDIVNGKGEYNLTFSQIWVWYQHYPELATYAFEKCVRWCDEGTEYSIHPYGSWKDIKYFSEFVKVRSGRDDHPLIVHAINLIAAQLRADLIRKRAGEPVSLAGKWCPREKSRFGWLYSKIVKQMVPIYFETTKTGKQYSAAMRKGCKEVRKILSELNAYLSTTQVAQCAKEWSTINFNNVTSVTMRKNTLAFQNTTKTGVQRSLSIDRIECSENLKSHVASALSGGTDKIHGKRVAAYELVRDALDAEQNPSRRDIVNLQWKDNNTQNGALRNFIPMADVSASMTIDNSVPLFNAIGLSLRVAEKTTKEFRDRVLTFSSHPEWVNLSNCPTFCEKVYKVQGSNWSMNTNLVAALKMILDVIIANNMLPEDVENLALVIFSDMQIDNASQEDTGTIFDKITQMYAEAGLSLNGVPYKPPHILFWNLRHTNGFPTLSSQKNVTMLSGYSPLLLNVFCEKGIEGLQECTPYKMITELMSHDRYSPLENKLMSQVMSSVSRLNEQ